MFTHVSVVQLNVHVTLWNIFLYVCVHVCLLHITVMHVSTNSHVSLQMTGKSHKCVITGIVHKFMGFLYRHLAKDRYPHHSSLLLMREPCPKAESTDAEEKQMQTGFRDCGS